MSSPPLFRSEPTTTRRLGAGGEAEVFAVSGEASLAYKRYHRPSRERSRKLQAMVEQPPEVPRDVALAWPVLLVGEPDRVDGFVMPQVGGGRSVPLVSVYNPQSRARTAPGFTWRYLLRTALNVARTVEALHAAGHVVGDLNESNLLVDRRARVALVDCDSLQVTALDGTVYPCTVGRPEYLAPELHGLDLSTEVRSEAADAFALAVLVFHLLLEGRHPYAGRWRRAGEPPDVPTRMRLRAWPYRRSDLRVGPPPLGLPLAVLPRPVRRLVRRTFTARTPAQRPSVSAWVEALSAAEQGLRSCRRSAQHVVPHGRRCPWCARVDAGLPDPFPGPEGAAVEPRLRAGVAARVRASAAEAWEHVRPWLARPVPLAVAAAIAATRWPVVVPLLASVLVVPLLAVLATPAAPTGRRRLDPRRDTDAIRRTVTKTAGAVRAGAIAGAAALGAAAVGTTGGWLLVGGSLLACVQAGSVAVTVGQALLAPHVVAAWSPLADRWSSLASRHPRLTSVVACALAAAAALAP